MVLTPLSIILDFTQFLENYPEKSISSTYNGVLVFLPFPWKT